MKGIGKVIEGLYDILVILWAPLPVAPKKPAINLEMYLPFCASYIKSTLHVVILENITATLK